MKAYNKLMNFREDYKDHYWNQMVEVNNPSNDYKTPYWENRILQELRFAREFSFYNSNKYDDIIEEISKKLLYKKQNLGYITKEDVLEAENKLMPMSKEIKQYKVHCVSHAHIDMNWLWGWHETVSIVIDTFKTMLKLMDEYKDFTYSQSQASTYKIIEDYCPEMLEEIKKRVHEGRWELSASTWVENDRNMSSGESFARHILYTKKYLSKLFDIDVDMLKLDFEPDCFGHSANIPEILSNGGVKYYYHCRGLENHVLYNWKAKSGAALISYREPLWYGHSITGNSFIHVPKLCNDYGIKEALFVYGVGDHGGGPTRRDIETLIDMNTWPIYPTLMFSTYHKFFNYVEKFRDNFPTVEGELNFTLTGCFTSSSRIKMANRYSENAMVCTELANTYTHILMNRKYYSKKFEDAWRKVLLNQFHDILPGCGINFTREYALGKFQEILATANTIRKSELEQIALNIDTSNIKSEHGPLVETAEGAGVGNHPARLYDGSGISFNTNIPQVSRYGGNTRLFTLFNHTPYEETRTVELMIWDYKEDVKNIIVYSSEQKPLNFEIIEDGYNQYWGHWYTKLLVEVKIPSFGYETIIITQNKNGQSYKTPYATDARVNKYLDYTLENDYLKAKFDESTLELISLYDKIAQKELISKNKGANFNYIFEDASGGKANAWVVGKAISINQVNREITNVKMEKNKIYNRLSYSLKLSDSVLNVSIALNAKSKSLAYNVKVIWNEIGNNKIPQLNYTVNFDTHIKNFIYDIPMGLINRRPLEENVPGCTFGMAQIEDDYGLYIATESKYGYRGEEDSFTLKLLRSTQYPDSHPETGVHYFDFLVGVGNTNDAIKDACLLNHPVDVINTKPAQNGILPLKNSFIEIDTNNRDHVIVTAVKVPENATNSMIIRLVEVKGIEQPVKIKVLKPIKNACFVDFLEREKAGDLDFESNTISFIPNKYTINSLKIIY